MSNDNTLKVPVSGYIALVCALLFFSGLLPVFASALTSAFGVDFKWMTAFDYSVLQGRFGTIGGGGMFRGSGGSGARDGFMFALTLVPGVMLAMGAIELIERYNGLKAAQKMLTPLLRPMLGIPGVSGLALISSLQSTDAGASMSKGLREQGLLTENERTSFGMFQFSGGAMITNFLSSGAALTAIVADPTRDGFIAPIIIISLLVIFAFKALGTNMMRLYLIKFGDK